MGKRIRMAAAAALMAGTIAGFTGMPAHASGGDATPGRCTGSSTSKISLGLDNGQIEVQFEVDQNVVGDTWKVVLADNGTVFFKGKRVTQPRSGSFEVRQFTANQAGTDTIVARAKNISTGEVCKATDSI